MQEYFETHCFDLYTPNKLMHNLLFIMDWRTVNIILKTDGKYLKKSKIYKIICYHICKNERNLPNPILRFCFSFEYSKYYSLYFSPLLYSPILTILHSPVFSKAYVFKNSAAHIFLCCMYRMCSTLLKTNDEEEFNWNMAYSADIELPEKRNMTENKATVVVFEEKILKATIII